MCDKKTFNLIILFQTFISFLLIMSLLVSGCSDSENEEEGPIVCPTDLHILTITDIKNIPDKVTITKVAANITGTCWDVINTVEAPYKDGQVILELPIAFSSEELQDVESTSENVCGHWRATSSDPEALVATLGDIIAYDNEGNKVGRIYLSNWAGQGSSAGKAFVYFQYADRAFTLSGSNNSYYYSDCSLDAGWNMYANINPSVEGTVGNIRCTTSIPDDMELSWCFESWVY